MEVAHIYPAIREHLAVLHCGDAPVSLTSSLHEGCGRRLRRLRTRSDVGAQHISPPNRVVLGEADALLLVQALNEFSDHEVHLYESDTRLGGHAHTVSFKEPGKKGAPAVDIDT